MKHTWWSFICTSTHTIPVLNIDENFLYVNQTQSLLRHRVSVQYWNWAPSVRTPAWPSEKTKTAAADLHIIASWWHHQTEELLLKRWNNMDSGHCRRTSKYCIDKHTPRPVGWWKTEMLQVIQEKATRQTGGKNAGRMNRF